MSASEHAPRRGAPTTPNRSETSDRERPRRASRVELVGPMQGMAYADRKWLICLDGSQYVQATELLYHLLLHADGETPVDIIASRVASETGRPVSGDEIRWLIVNKLAGSGLIQWASNGTPETGPNRAQDHMQTPSFLLDMKRRVPLIPYRVMAPVIGLLKHLYWPPLMVVAILAAAAINYWIFSGSGFKSSLVALFDNPERFLILFAIEIGLGLFVFSLLRLLAKALILFARLIYRGVWKPWAGHALRRARAQANASSPAAASVAAAPPPPTPLDGLGRPVPHRDGAPIEQALKRVHESPETVARELAEDLSRAYGRRLEQMAEEMTRMVAWTESVKQERDRLQVQVRTLEAAVSELSTDLKRIASEMEAAACAADRSLGTADRPRVSTPNTG